MASINSPKSKVTAEGKAFTKAIKEVHANGGQLKAGRPKSKRKPKESTPLFANQLQINIF